MIRKIVYKPYLLRIIKLKKIKNIFFYKTKHKELKKNFERLNINIKRKL